MVCVAHGQAGAGSGWAGWRLVESSPGFLPFSILKAFVWLSTGDGSLFP